METPNNTTETPQDGTTPKTTNYYETIDAYLQRTKVAITNSNHPQIDPVLTEYGYPQADIANGLALHADAESKQKIQIKEFGEQLTATDALANAIAAVREPYMQHLDLSRVAFKNQRGVLAELAAVGRRKLSQAGWLNDASTFYTNILGKPVYTAAMAKLGQNEAKLNAAFALVKTANEVLAARIKEAGEAQTATRERDIAIDALDDWFEDFIEVAKIALGGKPELLEILGVKQ